MFDLEVDTVDVDTFCDIVAALEPTFGGQSRGHQGARMFEIEEKLRARMNILFSMTISTAQLSLLQPILSGLISGASGRHQTGHIRCRAALAASSCCVGAKYENIAVTDIDGVVYKGRKAMNVHLEPFARRQERHAWEVIDGADVFLGLSAPGQ